MVASVEWSSAKASASALANAPFPALAKILASQARDPETKENGASKLTDMPWNCDGLPAAPCGPRFTVRRAITTVGAPM